MFGSAAAIDLAVASLRRRGRLCAVGVSGRPTLEVPWDRAMFAALDVTFSFSSSWTSWDAALALMRSGAVRIEPLDQVSRAQLLEWALIEPDVSKMRSTRRGGKPITWVKRLLLRGLQQYHNEVTYQQTRFNIHVLRKLLELEERVERLEGGTTKRTE